MSLEDFDRFIENQDMSLDKKLSRDEQCAWFAALKRGVPPQVVARAANVSSGTVSFLRRAGQVVGGQIRYPHVAGQFAAMGADQFFHTYLTPSIRERIAQAYADHKAGRAAPRLYKGVSSGADRKAGLHDWPANPKSLIPQHRLRMTFSIEFAGRYGRDPGAPEARGWWWLDLARRGAEPIARDAVTLDPRTGGRLPIDGFYLGDDDDNPFQTSNACFQYLRRRFRPTRQEYRLFNP